MRGWGWGCAKVCLPIHPIALLMHPDVGPVRVCVCARARASVCVRASVHVCARANVCVRARVRCTCVRARCVCRAFFCWAFSLTARLVLASLNPRPRSLTPPHTICEHGSGAEQRTLLPSPWPCWRSSYDADHQDVASTNHRLHFRTETDAQRFRTETDAQHAHRRARAYAQHNATPRHTQNISEHYSF